MYEIPIQPRLFMRLLLIFKGAHEIALLSWFFCVMAKEQEIAMIGKNHQPKMIL
jgi:hypothetical protein